MLSQAPGPDVCLAHTHGPPLRRPLCLFVLLRVLCDSRAALIFHIFPATPPVAPQGNAPWSFVPFVSAPQGNLPQFPNRSTRRPLVGRSLFSVFCSLFSRGGPAAPPVLRSPGRVSALVSLLEKGLTPTSSANPGANSSKPRSTHRSTDTPSHSSFPGASRLQRAPVSPGFD